MLKYVFLVFSQALCLLLNAQSNLTSFVNPFVGTGGHGHTFPGAVLPFGMVQLSPDTRVDNSWDGCSGYHYSDTRIYGFSHTHLSGTGVSDFGDILLVPTTGTPSVKSADYSSAFSHAKEKAQPGYYEVFLDDDKIKAELTVTPRVGIHKYTFSGKTGNVVLDLLHRDKTIDCGMVFVDSVTVYGYRISEAWAKKQTCYFTLKFNKPYKTKHIASNGAFIQKLGKFKIRPENGVFVFDVSDGQPLLVKVALSPVSTKGAEKNLLAEAPHWDFEKYKNEAQAAWEKQLSKIEIGDGAKEERSVFYTALYHASIHPSLNMDVDSTYRGRDNKTHTAKGFVNYSVFSLWDTYRALHPLFTLIEQKRTNDFINSFLAQYDQSGRLPMWELASNETDCMIGFHAASVIFDAYQKGIRGFDAEKAYQAVKAASNYSAFGIPRFNENNFLSVDDENESVSKTLEYGYDNWCVGQMALALNKKDEATVFFKRALAYQNLFDPLTGFMRPRQNGGWLTPFSPSEINNHFTEGNSWQYSFYVPHDINTLVDLQGGKEKFEKKLDELFTTREKNKGREQADVTGLIGQYAHGNEPSHHMAYLYNFVDRPEKAIERVSQIRSLFYKNSPDGLIGNEDCGQMSAWYILSALGIYQVCPGSSYYIMGSPLFSKASIKFESGTELKIKKPEQKIPNSVSFNGNLSGQSFIAHADIIKGGELNFETKMETGNYGKGSNAPVSRISALQIVPAPLIEAESSVFKQQVLAKINALGKSTGKIHYTIDGSIPSKNSLAYSEPILIQKTTTLKSRTFTQEDSSAVSEAIFYKLKLDADVRLISLPSPQYSANGGASLIDGKPSDLNWQKGNWIGIQGKNLEVLVDLKNTQSISALSLNTLQDSRSWILFPSKVDFYLSLDGKNFKVFGTATNNLKADDYNLQLHKFEFLGNGTNARYVKIVAQNAGKLPEWHLGKGGDSYIFADELEIR